MNKYSISILLIALLLLFACKDDNTSINLNPNLEAAKNNTLAEDIVHDIFAILHQAGYDSSLHANGSKEIFAATVMYQKSNDSVSIRVFYPSWYVVCPDSLKRKGQITLHLSGDFGEPGTSGKVSFVNFGVSNIVLSGNLQFQNTTPNDSIPQYALSTGNMSFLLGDSSSSIQWQSEKNIVWYAGSDSPQDFSDDVFRLSGTSSGTSVGQKPFSSQTTSPLIKSKQCRWIHGGSLDFSTPGMECQQGEIVYYEGGSCHQQFDMYFEGTRFYEEFIKLYRQN
ncbi:MAG: hypothetical protein K9G58_00725 [Bacteroidales bacterium]|nr:hypothetical protein [Bacteroidales bacterium]MCF8387995.1 hypothetical protein [Bacteroidales bacterium]MCF8396658.1 hypothetical protein [Bacteroidales bacterium]